MLKGCGNLFEEEKLFSAKVQKIISKKGELQLMQIFNQPIFI